MAIYQIKNWYNGSALFKANAKSLRECAEKAVQMGADLTGANLTRANLTWADLTWADLTGANLTRANLAGANLAGADLAGANLAGATGISDVMTLAPIGARRDILTATLTDSGPMVQTGCFKGTLDEFTRAIEKTHGDNQHGRDYRLAIALIRSRFGLDEESSK